MEQIKPDVRRMIRSDNRLQRDHDVALQLYELSGRIGFAHPRIADRLERAAEYLLKANELRMEGAVLALQQHSAGDNTA